MKVRSVLRGALVAVLAFTVVTVCSSSAIARTRTASHTVASLPRQGCTTKATSPGVVEQCGPCTVIGFHNASERDNATHAIGAATPGGAWFAVGGSWIAGDDQTTFFGAATCQTQLGGFIARYGS